ncbi:hypothetical protein [Ruminobacter sp.]|uniref:hypothetical protein n=1 Tax=Ruminobacter sp. TaxID=2774296 RepID=UPI00386C6E0A
MHDRYFREKASEIVRLNCKFFKLASDDYSLCISTVAIAEKDVVNGFRYFLDRISILYK